MNAKNMGKALKRKMDEWISHVDDAAVQDAIKENAIITGGALVSLLCGEAPNDYDIYFKTLESCRTVATYYANRWNDTHSEGNSPMVEIQMNNDRVTAFVRSVGVAVEKGESAIDDESEPIFDDMEPDVSETEEESKKEKPRYRPRYFSTNAISLTDKIQIVIRFYGSVEEIHKNYDFIHCTCSYDYHENKVDLPSRALEAIINKELYYVGSKYPVCSIIRSRKFIQRGWHINAGQYLKMCLQIAELNLKDLEVFSDQLAGVDSFYFAQAIEAIKKRKEKEPDFSIDNTYLFEVINRIF